MNAPRKARLGLALAWLHLGACATATTTVPSGDPGVLMRQGLWPEALAAYANALCQSATPQSPEALANARGLVSAWDKLGRPGPVEQRLLSCGVDAGLLAYVRGLGAACAGNYLVAAAHLQEAERTATPEVIGDVLLRRGGALLQAGRADAAAALFDEAQGRAPADPEPRLALAQARLRQGQLPAVAEILRGLLALTLTPQQIERGRKLLGLAVLANEPPLSSEHRRLVADTLALLEKGPLERQALAEVLDTAQALHHPRLLNVAGLATLRQGALSEARRLLEEAARQNPLDPDPLRALGTTLLASDHASEAVSPLSRAAARDPLDAELAERLARAAEAAGEPRIRREALRALVALRPTVTEYQLRLARSERQQGDLPAAERAALAAYRLDPKDIPVLLERATINVKLAHAAPTEPERNEALMRAQQIVGELLLVAPEHPGAKTLLEALPN